MIEEPTNLCVIIEKITESDERYTRRRRRQITEPLYVVYDFITNEQFYALESEICFI